MEANQKAESGHWQAVATIKKYKGDFTAEEIAAKGIEPYEVVREEDNILLNSGIAILMDKLIGAGAAQVFDNGHTRLGTGTGSTPAAAADPDLQANAVWVAMDATYPLRIGQTLYFQSTFGSGVATQAWNEWAIDNGSVAHVLLNHKAPVTFGPKPSGETWVFQVTVSLL